MKRAEKITRLIELAGFNPSMFFDISNKMLEETYKASIPLIRAKQEEIAKVLGRTNKRSANLRERRGKEQQAQQAALEWSIKWKHPRSIPIRTVFGEVVQVQPEPVSELEEAISCAGKHFEEYKELFRTTGNQQYAKKANEAREALRYLEEVKAGTTQ